MNKTKLISVVYALIGLGTYTILEAAPANDPVTSCGTTKPVSGLANKYGKAVMQPWAI